MFRTTAALTLSTFAAVALAEPHLGDVMLSVENGAITTSGITETGQLIPGSRVFLSELGEIAPNFTDEPGFDCEVGTFPFPGAIGFRVHGALQRWTGSGFAAQPGDSMLVEFSTLSVTTPSDGSTLTGFMLGVASNGTWHRHLEYTLQPPATQGVYLLELSLFSDTGTPAASSPFWIVFNQGESEEVHQAAAQWVEETLAGSCGSADFNGDGDTGTDADIEAFFACLGGSCCATCGSADFDADGDTGTDADIEAFFRVLGGGTC